MAKVSDGGMGGPCLVHHPDVIRQLCEWHYPYCRACRSHYKRWMKTEPEVQRLEQEAIGIEKRKGEKGDV